jgi:hypothetical protein
MWNYRIIKDKDVYGLYEVMYNEDGEICAHTEKPEVIGDSAEDLLQTLRLMLDDAQKSYYDILDVNRIKFSEFCKDISEATEITIEELDEILKELD